MMLPLRIELAMTFKAVFLNFWPGTDQDMSVLQASEAVSGCNILILPIDASVLRAFEAACWWLQIVSVCQSISFGLRIFDCLRVVFGEIGRHRKCARLEVIDTVPTFDPWGVFFFACIKVQNW